MTIVVFSIELCTTFTAMSSRTLLSGLVDCLSILARWRNHFSQLLNVPGINDVRQAEICTAEPLVFEPSTFEVEMAVEKLKRHKSPGTDQIPTELIKA